MTVLRNKTLTYSRALICALFALCAAGVVHAQTAPPEAQSQPQKQIVDAVEAQAEAYKSAIAKTPIEVQQTVRFFDVSGHLKKTSHSTFRYSPVAVAAAGRGKIKRSAFDTGSQQSGRADLSDGVTLPFVFLPGSIIHLSMSAETPATGPWILHFKSSPCPPPQVHRHWLESNIVSECVEGEAFLDPASDSIARIRMNMAGLPIGFRSLAYPLGVIVLQLSNDVSFRALKSVPGAPPRLLPEKAEYVTYTTHGRTVVDQRFEPAPASPQASVSP